ncbi:MULTISPECIES: type I DNA topoisomerase [unclassified Nocardioides]|uniref:type I DNA topoisomerase n=1 Tax=unclassified Nocardioides TaxID=2615069 RepID=UPI0006F6F432|nr:MULTISPECIES: type I DNA topoisomerase [unclassified Nocardioides]KRA29810.1 DNA topoisomerase I [Nocardioides sp. Root614]KRA86733.1 DNA topoisomerase I [Nocardioides sp. Root682]
MAHKLVIVESPAKARTIGGYLGDGFVVESSIGHIRDLPNNAADTPAKIKDKPWGRLAIDVENGFVPYYVVPRDKKSHIAKLKSLLKDADELYLATDEDREGEAIAWHLLDELKPKNIPVRRMVFHEITKAAIQEAAANPRELDMDLVEAQETRRLLDRLYGYEVSPVLWRKIMSGLSAGRVQSVATRLVVDREKERMAFKMASYWDLEGTFDAGSKHDQRMFPAKLHTIDGTRVAGGSNFGQDGQLKGKAEVVHLDRPRAEALVAALADTAYDVRSVEAKPYRRSPYAPFRTTTLQQEASRKLGMSASVTMSVAQRLYENGHITYMRTDSTTLSGTAISAARSQVAELYGSEYVPDEPRTYTSKVKNAQEAHEAIRPAGDSFKRPGETGLTGDQFRLYELIWMRTVASQMKDAVGQSVSIRLGGAAASGEDVVFSATGRVITFHGFLKAYVEGTDDTAATKDDQETRLPNLQQGDSVSAASISANGHETKPPSRFTEATLIKELEEREIGRPSTYASIIGTILNRGYVYKKGTALVPAWIAFSVVRLLTEHFSRLIDYEFTAGMEEVLDQIARGEKDRTTELTEFYYGSDTLAGLLPLVQGLGDIDARELATFPVGTPEDGINLRVGKYGPYLEGPDDDGAPLARRANVPDDLPPDELTVAKAIELLANPAGEEIELGVHPETGLQVVAKNGRYGPYVTELIPEPAEGAKPKKGDKPRTGSLFKSMSLDTVTLEDAIKLLALPRVVGVGEDGEEITAQNGRYGPYLKKGTDARSLTSEDQIFGIQLDEALKIYAQPKQRGRAAAAPPLKELGNDPVSGQPIVVKAGRFGEYVTDGEYNATLRKDDSVEAITLERAAELLAERREKGPAKKAAKKTAKKAPAKKAAAKKTAAKKTAAKKAPAKKTAAKKS